MRVQILGTSTHRAVVKSKRTWWVQTRGLKSWPGRVNLGAREREAGFAFSGPGGWYREGVLLTALFQIFHDATVAPLKLSNFTVYKSKLDFISLCWVPFVPVAFSWLSLSGIFGGPIASHHTGENEKANWWVDLLELRINNSTGIRIQKWLAQFLRTYDCDVPCYLYTRPVKMWGNEFMQCPKVA